MKETDQNCEISANISTWLDPGMYYVGDPSHVLDERDWECVLRDIRNSPNRYGDVDTVVADRDEHSITGCDRRVIAFGTGEIREGACEDADRFSYRTRSGFLGVVEIMRFEKWADYNWLSAAADCLGRVVWFQDAECFADGDWLVFGEIKIQTIRKRLRILGQDGSL